MIAAANRWKGNEGGNGAWLERSAKEDVLGIPTSGNKGQRATAGQLGAGPTRRTGPAARTPLFLSSAVVAHETCTQGPPINQPSMSGCRHRTFRISLPPSQRNKLGFLGVRDPDDHAVKHGSWQVGEATSIVRHARHWYAAIQTTVPTRRFHPPEPWSSRRRWERNTSHTGDRQSRLCKRARLPAETRLEAVFAVLPATSFHLALSGSTYLSTG